MFCRLPARPVAGNTAPAFAQSRGVFVPDLRPTLLLTRPLAQSRRFAAEFVARYGADWPVVISPLLEIVTVPAEVPPAPVVVFTSESAVAPFAALSPAAGRRAWCVGPRTAKVAEAAGFVPILGPGEAQGLVRAILAEETARPLLHARGRHVAAELAALLNAAGVQTLEATVYDQIELPPSIEEGRLLATDGPLLVPLFSPRSARLFAKRAANAQARLWIAAISAAAAAPLVALTPARLEVAPTPDAAGMMLALDRIVASADAG